MTAGYTYQSIFLRPSAPHEKYYGWSVAEEGPGFRVLRKSHGVVVRNLVLLSREGLACLPDIVARNSSKWGTSDMIVHDFDDVVLHTAVISGLRFHRASDSERILNTATFVMDLSHDEDTLLRAMSADYRRKIRKAMDAGIIVHAYSDPGPEKLLAFGEAYRAFAASRGLPSFDAGAIERMYEAGDALLFTTHRNGDITNYLHLYTAGDTALFMYGVNIIKENDGAGQLLHWEAMRELRSRGFRWYDLGGVAHRERTDGIFNFKEKFGGQFVHLGTEWRHVGVMLKPMLAANRFRRRHFAALPS
jgi:hypothetical protein